MLAGIDLLLSDPGHRMKGTVLHRHRWRVLLVTLGLLVTTAGCDDAQVDPAWHAAAPPAVKASSAGPKQSSAPADADGEGENQSQSLPKESSIPRKASGSFATAAGPGEVIGEGKKLVRFRIEVETGIKWGDIPKWTPKRFSEEVDDVLGAPQGWGESSEHPVTNAKEHMTRASWKFQRVKGSQYDVRIRLATAETVNRACASAGLNTEGEYSCKFGKTIMVNLKRWLRGAPGYPVTVDEYHSGVINHEMGHFLGFNHMACGGKGKPGPVMQTQTIDLQGCVPNVHPYTEAGKFITGPWRPS
jgi:hypothetical protein